MNTMFLLMAEYESTDILLESVAKKYLGLEPAQAKRMASMHRLPMPCYRAGSQKSPWLVRVTDLADFLDKQRADAAKDWHAMNAPTGATRLKLSGASA